MVRLAATSQFRQLRRYSVSGDTITFYNTKEEEENGKTPVGSLELGTDGFPNVVSHCLFVQKEPWYRRLRKKGLST